MDTSVNYSSLTVRRAFEHFLEVSAFARRTRESYTEDLKPLLAQIGQAPITALTDDVARSFLVTQEALAPATYNRRLAALRSFIGFLQDRGWLTEALLERVERKSKGTSVARALDAQKVESVLRGIENPRDRALFWLIYDGGLRCQEALAIDIDDLSWSDRSILLHGKGGRSREMFFSRTVGTLLDKYLATRGYPTSGPLFVTHRKARLPRRADLTADGYARLSYRQADTLWKGYTPEWNLHQLRHTAISVRAAHGYTEVDLKRFSGHTSLRSLERYIADNREAAKRKAREWERRQPESR
jgi:integrase